jgi:hypothetical protein
VSLSATVSTTGDSSGNTPSGNVVFTDQTTSTALGTAPLKTVGGALVAARHLGQKRAETGQCPISASFGMIRKPGPAADGCPGRSHSRTFRVGYAVGEEARNAPWDVCVVDVNTCKLEWATLDL